MFDRLEKMHRLVEGRWSIPALVVIFVMPIGLALLNLPFWLEGIPLGLIAAAYLAWAAILLFRMVVPGKSPPPRIFEPPLRDRAHLEDLINRCGLTELADELFTLAEPRFTIFGDGDASQAALGATRLGGWPDLPDEAAWPRDAQGRHANFLAQFDMTDMAQRAPSPLLPTSGLLSLFVIFIESAADPVLIEAVLTPAGAPLRRLTVEEDQLADEYLTGLKPIFVRFEPGLSLPINDAEIERKLGDVGDCEALKDACRLPDGAIGQWLGYASTAHFDDFPRWLHLAELGHEDSYDLRIWNSWPEWEAAKANVRSRSYQPWTDAQDDAMRWLLKQRQPVAAGAASWRHLVQIESNSQMNLWINDADPVFVFIRKADLAAGDFSRIKGRVTQG